MLLVEDDAELRGLLADHLIAKGLLVDGAGSVAQARRMLARAPATVVVLDVQLPDGSGLAIASHLRKQGSATGILMLSRHDDPAWQVAGLDVGADMYLSKPVDGELLHAAVRSVVRRLRAPRPDVTPVGESWLLTDAGWTLQAPDGRRIDLGGAERTMLQALAAEPGRVVSRDRLRVALAEAVGEGSFSSHRLDMLVHRLRTKIEGAGLPPLPLKSVRGQGFVLLHEHASRARTSLPDAEPPPASEDA